MSFFARLSRTSKLMILGIVLLLGITAYATYAKFKAFAQMGAFTMPPAGVVVTQVEPVPFADTIEAMGTAAANESATLTSKVTETVSGILFTEGQWVQAGTVLVELSDAEEKASLVETERAFARADELVKRKAVSEARKDQEQARMDMARAQLEDRQIRAPFDGTLGLRNVSIGDLVSPGTLITTIDDIDPIKLEFTVPESFLSAVTSGLQINAVTEAFPGHRFTGTVTAIDPRVDPATRAFRVKAEIVNTDARLKPGLLMSVNIIRNSRSALGVPEQALQYKGDAVSVMIVGADKKVAPVPVTLGTRRSGFVEITSGLNAGDQVIVEGLVKVQPGAEVSIAGTKKIGDFIKDAVDFAVTGKQDALTNLGAGLPTTPETAAPAEQTVPSTATEGQ